jgi:hypothetical protein
MNDLGIGTTELLIIAVAIAVELALLLWALVDLIKRPEAEILGGRKWPWILLVAFVNLIGPIVYLTVGRTTPTLAPGTGGAVPGTDRTRAAVETLYGDGSAQGEPDR